MPDPDFSPNWLSAPGRTIAEIASARGLSEIDLSERLGLTLEQTRRIIGGNSPITDEIASVLSETVGGTPRFWIDRETRFRSEIDRQTTQGSDEARRAWLDQLPIKEMIRLRWIARRNTLEDKVSECLRFFDSMSLGEWRKSYSEVLSAVAFRAAAAFDAMPGSVLAWLQFGKSQAAKIDCADWNKELFRKSLSEIRRLTRSPRPTTFVPRLREICARCGVAVVVAPTPKGCHASGATCFLSPKKAMILLSFRYRSDDQFWFTVFHEAGHLILHEQSALFVEDGSDVTANEEQEANPSYS